MKKINVTVTKDFIETISTARPMDAIAELIWNGFDAGSNKVQVYLGSNDLDGLQEIRVRDEGYGIDPTKIDDFFGSLGESWKKKQGRQNGRALHGKNGKGRFKAFALGEHVEWRSTFEKDGKQSSFTITGTLNSLDNFEISDPVDVKGIKTGTEVMISNMLHDFHSLKNDSAPLEFAKTFAAYLTEYPNVVLEYNGKSIDPKAVQSHRQEYNLGDVAIEGGEKTPVAVSIVEWNVKTEREIHLCDANGVSLHKMPAGQIKAPGFNFTAYIKSPHFRELDKTNLLMLADMHKDAQSILRVAKNKIKEHFRFRILEGQSKIIERWKEEDVYPYEDKPDLNPVEQAERQVFDILAVNVSSYLPSFENFDTKSRKFTFKLLAQAIKDNPDSVQTIIGEMLDLKKTEQDDLAKLLKKTTLSSIISSAKIVANRLDFLIGLDNLLFDKDSKKMLLERDQLHKILDNEAWIFNEEFALAGSEQRLEEVLNKHLDKLGKREDDPDPVLLPDGKTGRVDLLLHKSVQPRTGEYDYLVIELKRPSQKIDEDVITQIKKYAMAVAKDERFRDVPVRWTFVAISNELNDFAKSEANQKNRPRGMVWDGADQNITVWVKSWAEVINDARARLNFFNEQLSYEADRDSAKSYLREAHAKFIPENYEENSDGSILEQEEIIVTETLTE